MHHKFCLSCLKFIIVNEKKKHVVFKGKSEELSIPTTGRREMCEEFSSALLFREKNRREYEY